MSSTTSVGDALLEIIKTVGGFSGICTAIFLVYDRCTKHYPVAFIEARPLIEGSRNIVPFLFVKNVSDRPILVWWQNGRSDRLMVARDQTAEGILRYLSDGDTTIALSSEAEAVLPILRPHTYPEIDPENMMELEAAMAVCTARLVAQTTISMGQDQETRF